MDTKTRTDPKAELAFNRFMRDFFGGATYRMRRMFGGGDSTGSAGGTPPPHVPSGSSGGGDGGGWKSLFPISTIRKILKFCGWFLVIVTAMLLFQWLFRFQDEGADHRADREILRARAQADLDDRAAARAATVAVRAPQRVAEVELPAVRMFDCSTEEKKEQGFNSSETQVFSEGMHAGSGCAWVEVITPVTRVDGRNFRIDLLVEGDPSQSYKCGTNAPAGSVDCARFLNTLRTSNDHPDKKVRLIVQNGGYIKIYPKQ